MKQTDGTQEYDTLQDRIVMKVYEESHTTSGEGVNVAFSSRNSFLIFVRTFRCLRLRGQLSMNLCRVVQTSCLSEPLTSKNFPGMKPGLAFFHRDGYNHGQNIWHKMKNVFETVLSMSRRLISLPFTRSTVI